MSFICKSAMLLLTGLNLIDSFVEVDLSQLVFIICLGVALDSKAISDRADLVYNGGK